MTAVTITGWNARTSSGVTTPAGETDYDLVVLPGTTAEIAVPALDPRVIAPTTVGPADAERAYLHTRLEHLWP